MTLELSFTDAFTSALRGTPTRVTWSTGEAPTLLPVASWTGQPDGDDLALLDLCQGATLDIGCGPGRLTQELTRRGHRALGVDVVPEAVQLTRRRGAAAVVADVFDPVPDEGRWATVLLADGNVGIAGDPARLLHRVCELLRPGGRAVVEVSPPGTGSSSGWTTLEGPLGRSRPFRWARVDLDDVAPTAATAGLTVLARHRLGPAHAPVGGDSPGRWAVVLGARA